MEWQYVMRRGLENNFQRYFQAWQSIGMRYKVRRHYEIDHTHWSLVCNKFLLSWCPPPLPSAKCLLDSNWCFEDCFVFILHHHVSGSYNASPWQLGSQVAGFPEFQSWIQKPVQGCKWHYGEPVDAQWVSHLHVSQGNTEFEVMKKFSDSMWTRVFNKKSVSEETAVLHNK